MHNVNLLTCPTVDLGSHWKCGFEMKQFQLADMSNYNSGLSSSGAATRFGSYWSSPAPKPGPASSSFVFMSRLIVKRV
jgi:hypothetical protein